MYTREQIIEKCKQTHNNEYDYSLLPEDVRMSSTVPIICKKHGVFEQCLKKHIANHQGCPECGNENRIKRQRTKGFSQFIKTSKDRFGDKYSFPYIDKEYVNSHSIITIHCNDCDNTFQKRACDHITSVNGGCTECIYESKRTYYTHEELLALSNGKIHIKKYDGNLTKNDFVTCICPKHGEYKVLVSTILDGRGFCKKCNGNINKDESDRILNLLKDKINNVYRNKFTVNYPEVTTYSSKVSLKCNDCGYTFTRMVKTIIENDFLDCARCKARIKGEEKKKTTEEYIEQARTLYGDIYDYSITEYNGSSQKIRIRCNKCGNEFEIEANSHLQGHGCPYHYCNKSIMEEELLSYIRSIYDGNILNNNRNFIGNGYELDIVIPDKNIAIEFDGLYWHNEINHSKNYHLDKTTLCQKNGIHLIHIFEDEWINKNKQIIWKSILKNQIGETANKIYARKCTIRTVNHKEGYDFLNRNHLQGSCQSSIMLGLYYKDRLVSLMTFGKSRHFIGNGKYEYELLRFCNKLDTEVVGGASKLFKYFVKTYNPKSIVSYADKRWSNGHLYEVLGFEKYNESKPNYYYVIGNERKNRFNFRKSILMKKYNCPKEMSEHDFCLSQKWYRIYDCGCYCYKFENNK